MPIPTLSYTLCRDKNATFTISRSRKRKPTTMQPPSTTTILNSNYIPILPSENLPNPFAQLSIDLSDSELKETAYEIFIAACRSSGGARPLTYISPSDKGGAVIERAPSFSSSAPSLQRSLTSSAASKVKKALGLKYSKKNGDLENSKRPVTIGELMRVQMRISEQTDSRIRRALLRIAAGQLGRRMESIVLPLELLHQFKSSDFPTQREYEAWQRRNLRMLEAGLLLHNKLPFDKSDTAPQRLREIIHGAYQRPIETGKHSEALQPLRTNVMHLACRSFDGSVSETCHWADGVPLNLRLYQTLLEACFDVNEPASVIEEVDEVLELIKKTWVVLGIDQMFHNLCFAWALFHRYFSTGQVENELLFAADNLLLEVGKDAKTTYDPAYSKLLSSVLRLILEWADKRLLAYHDTFYRGNIDLMQSVLSLGLSAAKILAVDISHGHRRGNEADVVLNRVNSYIRSSIRTAFAQIREKVILSRKLAKTQQHSIPVLSILAQDISDLAFNEKEIYSPLLKQWHPLAIGVAVATLHTCYGNELTQYVSGISELTPEVIQVLISADKLEKDLVQMAVEDSVDSEDGGKSIIQEMSPYEAEGVIAELARSWIKTRIDRLKEWVDRNLQQEVWSPQANKERFAPSAVEVLRLIDETLEAFFLLPIPMHPALLPDLMSGLDGSLQHYIVKAKSGSGSRNTYLPIMPGLTRCRTGSKLNGVFRRKDKSNIGQRRKPEFGTMNGDNSFSIPHLCVRINTLQYIRKDLEVLQKRIINHLKNTGSTDRENLINGSGKGFELSSAACLEGIHQLCEATAYKVVFHDLSHVLWDSLYVGDVSSSRIEPFLEELEQNLVVISDTVHDRVRTRVITDIMKASFDGYLLVLLAGGPMRSFTLQDSAILEEDFRFLKDLFWSNGDGLPTDLINKFSATVNSILPLFGTDTESLIELLKSRVLGSNSSSTKSRLPMPPNSGQWGPTEPNTVLRVLCYRNDKLATKFLKKAYNLPKKL